MNAADIILQQNENKASGDTALAVTMELVVATHWMNKYPSPHIFARESPLHFAAQ